jgi:hypothetical protein
MTVSGSQDIRVQTIADAGVTESLANTPLAQWADVFVRLAKQYQIDQNWIISYLRWETGFGAAGPGGRHPSMDLNDPWDLLCGTPETACSGAKWDEAVCTRAPNGYCYYRFPTMEAGIEAGYQNWGSYVARGWTTWFSSLSVALCGRPGGCDSPWVGNVIQQGQQNEARWPPVPVEPPGPPANHSPIIVVGLILVGAGAAMLLSSGGAR